MLKNIQIYAALAFMVPLTVSCARLPLQAMPTFAALNAEQPKSILVLPPLNNTMAVNAPEYFLSTLSRPFANRGYYAFPANMVRKTLEENGLSDAGLVHAAQPVRLQSLFGCDAALYVTINRWDTRYLVIQSSTTVSFDYELKSCKTNELLWKSSQTLEYSPSQSNSGNALADLIASAVVAAVQKAAPNYIPLAQNANFLVTSVGNTALPPGPYGLVAPN
jgi:hypothetical protein